MFVMHFEMSFLYVSIHLGVLDYFHKSRILGRFSKYNVSTMTTARVDLKTELTTGSRVQSFLRVSRSHSRLRCLC